MTDSAEGILSVAPVLLLYRESVLLAPATHGSPKRRGLANQKRGPGSARVGGNRERLMFRNGVTGGAGEPELLLGLGAGLGGSVGGTGAAGCCCCCCCCWSCHSRFIFSRSRSRSNLTFSRSLRRIESLLLNSSVTTVPSLLFRMTWGVIRKMSSVRMLVSTVVRNKRPSTGTSMRYGMPVRFSFLLSAMIPPIARCPILNNSRCLRLADIKTWK